MLTLPLLAAAATAGVLGGIHCAGMCGGIGSMLSAAGGAPRKVIPIMPQPQPQQAVFQHVSLYLHAGRLSAYALMGAVVGMLGGLGLLLKPIMPVHSMLFFIGNLSLIWLGLRVAGVAPGFASLARLGQGFSARLQLPARFSLSSQTRRHPYLVGMAWGCLPCGLLYGVLPFALLSGDALSGAALMLVFGLGALPYLLFAQAAANWTRRSGMPLLLKAAGAMLLIGLGIYGLAHADMNQMSSLLCVTPLH